MWGKPEGGVKTGHWRCRYKSGMGIGCFGLRLQKTILWSENKHAKEVFFNYSAVSKCLVVALVFIVLWHRYSLLGIQ